ncbi:MAG: GNAT family N-acetyltransferase [Candidatus Cyclonatronum sp.]|uniref:GNAT family N-acetyltransferase n=1 Tax=Cyclonatronum sp. TaxID=3024185 RepID=UPI0025C631C7|nr:GNAT family N-acetyltransferase [Cyclonatronum sp.]MCH8486332.1 GNAT family N-acetyltransferase [Cyclonatronum sp.]
MPQSKNPEIQIRVVRGEQIAQFIPALAWLRITVFHEFPYLYDGSDEYERAYLKTYLNSDESLFVLATDSNKVVGASSGMPLKLETDEVKAPFIQKGIDPECVFYFGESVLLKQYRGLGIGKKFFEEREKHALTLGYRITAFCGVQRPDDHARKPAGYRNLHSFWEMMGYRMQPDMRTQFSWQDLDENTASEKEMMFWIKEHPPQA